MSLPLYEQGLRNAFARDISDPDCAKQVSQYLGALRCGGCPEWLSSFLFQRHAGAPNQYDAYAMVLLLSWSAAGWIAFLKEPVGVGPSADRMVDENNTKLRNLRPPYRARFRPELHVGNCDDGWVSWVRPVEFTAHRRPHIQQPSRVPMEVGATAAGRTLLHLREDGGVARWAYDSTDIVVCVVTEAGRQPLGCFAHILIDPPEDCPGACDDRSALTCCEGWDRGERTCSCRCHASNNTSVSCPPALRALAQAVGATSLLWDALEEDAGEAEVTRCASGEHRPAGESAPGMCADCGVDFADLDEDAAADPTGGAS